MYNTQGTKRTQLLLFSGVGGLPTHIPRDLTQKMKHQIDHEVVINGLVYQNLTEKYREDIYKDRDIDLGEKY